MTNGFFKKIIVFFFNRNRKIGSKIELKNMKMGVSPSPKDERDYRFSLALSENLPEKKDNSVLYQVKNQGNIGSCGSFAAINGLEFLDKKRADLSENNLYFKVRQKDYMNTFPLDSGSNGRNLMKVLNKEGAILEAFYPYDVLTYNNGSKANASFLSYVGKFWRVNKYESLSDILSIKKALSDDKPVWLGISVQEDWFVYDSFSDPLAYDPSKASIGGHAIALVGYDDSLKSFKFVNSWGNNWGEDGFGWITYDYFFKCSWWESWTFEV
jgi:C1A family cysteine protease